MIDKYWRDYQMKVIPRDAPLIQIQESRRAFYAGANALFSGMLSMLEPGREATEKDLQKMTDLENEFIEFTIKIKKGIY